MQQTTLHFSQAENDYRTKEAYKTDKEFESLSIEKLASEGKLLDKAKEIVAEVDALSAKELSTKHDIDEVEKNIAKVEPWGDFSKDKIEELGNSGYKVFFWACPSKLFKAECGAGAPQSQ